MPKTIRAILRAGKIATFFATDSLSALVPARPRGAAVIVRLDAIGDFFVWLQSGALEVTRFARQSSAEVILLANRLWADYARELGLWDRVIGIDPQRFARRPLYRLRILAELRKLGAQLLVQPRAARIFLLEDSIVRMSGASRRIGSRGVIFNTTRRLRRWGDSCYDQLIAVREQLDLHEVERNRDFVLGLTGVAPSPFPLPVCTATAADTVVIAIGAGWSGRVWPIERLARVVQHLHVRRPGWPIVVVGAAQEQPLAARLQQLLDTSIQNLAGRTDIGQLVALISSARLVICNESAAYHIAAAFGRHVLCFLGGGHYGWFAPYPSSHAVAGPSSVLCAHMECFGCNWKCRYPLTQSGAVRCLDSISVAAALEALDRILDRGEPPSAPTGPGAPAA